MQDLSKDLQLAVLSRVCAAYAPDQPGILTLAAVCKKWRKRARQLQGQHLLLDGLSHERSDGSTTWLRNRAGQLAGLVMAGPRTEVHMAALAAAASSTAAQGVPLRLQRLVLDCLWGAVFQTVHETVRPLLGVLPHLQHVHLRLLPQGNARWLLPNAPREEEAVLALAEALRGLTGLTSLVLEGPTIYTQQHPQQQQQLGPEAGVEGWEGLQVRGPPLWVAGLCSALPPSLQELQWSVTVRAHAAGHVQLLPLQLGHLTALKRLTLGATIAGDERAAAAAAAAAAVPRETLQSLKGLQQLELGMMLLPLGAMAQQANRLVHWAPLPSPLVSGPAAAAAITQLVAQLSRLVSLDLSALAATGVGPHADAFERAAAERAAAAAAAATEAAVRAVCSSAPQLTRLHLGLHFKRREDNAEQRQGAAVGFTSQGPLQRLTCLRSLRQLVLTIQDANFIPAGLRCLTQLTQLRLSLADNLWHSDSWQAMLSMWVWAIAPLTQLQALSIPGLLVASSEPWLPDLSHLVVLHLGWKEKWNASCSCMMPMASRRLGQFACAPESALQLVLLDPGAAALRKQLVLASRPSKVLVAVANRAAAVAAGQEAWPPEVWRALQ